MTTITVEPGTHGGWRASAFVADRPDATWRQWWHESVLFLDYDRDEIEAAFTKWCEDRGYYITGGDE